MKLKQRYRAAIVFCLVLVLVCSTGILTLLELGGGYFLPVPAVTDTAAEATPEPTPSPRPTPSPTPAPPRREPTELLTLVNPWHKLPDGYVPEIIWVGEEQYIDVRCYDDLMRMLDDCQLAGNTPYICSGYRMQETQEYLYNNKIARLIDEGVDPEEAPDIAARSVARPGTSEHQLGLAVDIIDYYFTDLTQEQEQTGTQQWLMEHCWDYGFILRYPTGKSDITGIIYEPWHYRYVGTEAAREIHQLDVTLEEYLEMFY